MTTFCVLYSRPPHLFQVHASSADGLSRAVQELDERIRLIDEAKERPKRIITEEGLRQKARELDAMLKLRSANDD